MTVSLITSLFHNALKYSITRLN